LIQREPDESVAPTEVRTVSDTDDLSAPGCITGSAFRSTKTRVNDRVTGDGSIGPIRARSSSGQWRAMRHGIDGIPGNFGNVESASYRI
jgi:hypothetical protein